MNEIDWSKAPDWAKKHGLSGAFKSPVWFDDKKYTYVDGQQDGKEFFYTDACTYVAKDFSHVSERPPTPSWSGEGVPVVGATLEATDKTLNDGAWTKVVILAVGKHGKDDCVLMAEVLDDKGRPGMMVASLYTQYEGCFRPLRTPEQIAADEQETATDVMFARFGGVAGLTRKQCAWVISEGYRKP